MRTNCLGTSKASPFGRESRRDILARDFAARPVTIDRAWEFVYRELLWIDGGNGLAHLYESDKAQPGRSVWYERSVRFTERLCAELAVRSVAELKEQIDLLFKECLRRLVEHRRSQLGTGNADPASGEDDAAPTDEDGREPSEEYVPDADLVAQFGRLLTTDLKLPFDRAEPLARELVAQARRYFTVERKRQNVLGEGFEDLLELLLAKLTHIPEERILVRQRADALPGFRDQGNRDRIESPDIAVVVDGETRLLASIKWSLRQDRQKQLSDELDCYAGLLVQDNFPRYVLITNEYDPGRLVNTNLLARRGQRIDCIYHISPDLLREVLSDGQKYREEILPLVKAGRIRSIADFLADMETAFGLTPDRKGRRSQGPDASPGSRGRRRP